MARSTYIYAIADETELIGAMFTVKREALAFAVRYDLDREETLWRYKDGGFGEPVCMGLIRDLLKEETQ